MSEFQKFLEERKKTMLKYYEPLPSKPLLPEVKRKGLIDRKGRCYELAWEKIKEENEGLLVHGKVFSEDLGKMIFHAWYETDIGYVWEPVADTFFKKEAFYSIYKAEPENKYTPAEAIKMAFCTKTYGFWTEEERKRCLKILPEVKREGSSNPDDRDARLKEVLSRPIQPRAKDFRGRLTVVEDKIWNVPDGVCWRCRLNIDNHCTAYLLVGTETDQAYRRGAEALCQYILRGD